ncbi:hypothetical protein CCUS01_05002 [Colletotrichum cuscutae]|uniref:Uncharacterized protein n=1 Tax=Colletotrichum cuscutae TaxID=1209917 RepID=A0AAI9V8Q4_9PEZI|nr:hypothetical protein CCUS01_05002 [Colletotrichum cuscutae]
MSNSPTRAASKMQRAARERWRRWAKKRARGIRQTRDRGGGGGLGATGAWVLRFGCPLKSVQHAQTTSTSLGEGRSLFGSPGSPPPVPVLHLPQSYKRYLVYNPAMPASNHNAPKSTSPPHEDSQ